MAFWMVRAGKHGQHERKFLDENRVYATWDDLNHDLGQLSSTEQLRDLLRKVYPNFSERKIINHSSQLWAFSHDMSPGDWIAIPSKMKPAIHFAEITGAYSYDSEAQDPYYHSRPVRWIESDVPRSKFPQDLLNSLGAFLTICRIEKNDAENRIRKMAENEWRPSVPTVGPAEALDGEGPVDFEQLARDQIAKYISQNFKGDNLERLLEALLRAQGYTTYKSPKGPDKGVDILAAPGALGFGKPRICVQVKSGDTPVDLPTLNQLIGTMQNVQAEQGLLVSWGGFKTSVDREAASQFFRVRLWDQTDVIQQLLEHYHNLDDDLKTELPLKRVWTLAFPEQSQ